MSALCGNDVAVDHARKGESYPFPMPTIYSVSELTSAVRSLLEGHIGEVWVEGELFSGRDRPGSSEASL